MVSAGIRADFIGASFLGLPRCFVHSIRALLFLLMPAIVTVSFGAGCGQSPEPGCVGYDCNGEEEPGNGEEEPGNGEEENGDHPPNQQCVSLVDLTDLIGSSELFFGYSFLAEEGLSLSCGSLQGERAVITSLTPSFTGDLVLGTAHPSTRTDTVIEVREGDCEGPVVGCAEGNPGASLTIPVEAGNHYKVLVGTADDESGIFALGLHEPGVCEGMGIVENITPDLLTGRRFIADTRTSTSSHHGSCSPDEGNPEALFRFTAPWTGTLVATTAHPDTNFHTLLHARKEDLDGTSYCASPEAEIACGLDGAPADLGTLIRVDVLAGSAYDLFLDGAGPGAQGEGEATLLLGYLTESPARASLHGCDHHAIRDEFAFFAQSGQQVFVMVDTVDAATAADTRLRVRYPDGEELYEADDEIDCTYPPPRYRCPEHEFLAEEDGLYTLEVYVGVTEHCFDQNLANYEITVKLDGADTELYMLRDQ